MMSTKKHKPVSTKPAVKKIPKSDITASSIVRVATSNLFILDEKPQSTTMMADAIIEDIGGQEIINLTRNDLLNGQNISYSVIANLASTAEKFNPMNMIKMQGTDKEFFGNFDILLNDYIPEVGTGADINGNLNGNIVYVDQQTGEVIINTINLNSNQRIEVEFFTYDNAVNDTIYI